MRSSTFCFGLVVRLLLPTPSSIVLCVRSGVYPVLYCCSSAIHRFIAGSGVWYYTWLFLSKHPIVSKIPLVRSASDVLDNSSSSKQQYTQQTCSTNVYYDPAAAAAPPGGASQIQRWPLGNMWPTKAAALYLVSNGNFVTKDARKCHLDDSFVSKFEQTQERQRDC